MRMLCYGDSNTYGYDPRGAFGGRYPAESRWVDILAEKTGWLIQNEGQNGRGVPSRPSQYEILMQHPVDLIAVMLGTNDLLQGRTATDTCARMEKLLCDLQPKCRLLLLIAPPHLKRGEWVTEDNLIAESENLTESYGCLSQKLGIPFLDAELWGIGLTYDGVHFTEEGHRAFAEGFYRYLMKLECIAQNERERTNT